MLGDVGNGPHIGTPVYEDLLEKYFQDLEKEPDNKAIHLEIAKTYYILGNTKKAEYHLKIAINDPAIFPEVCKELGKLFYEQDRFRQFLQPINSPYSNDKSIASILYICFVS